MIQAVEYAIEREGYEIRVRRSNNLTNWHITYMTDKFPISVFWDCICEVFAELSEDICDTVTYHFTDRGVERNIIFARGESKEDYSRKVLEHLYLGK